MRITNFLKRTALLTLGITAFLSHPVMAQESDVMEQADGYEWPTDKEVLNKLEAWQDLKFGVLFHWGVYAVPGICESWPLCNEDWINRDTTVTYQDYKKWYWGLSKVFNPIKFNPNQWADVMAKAGMKYMIFTTKHHDGFCLFDTKQTTYSIAKDGPFRNHPQKDVAKYVFQAFRDKNFMIGAYFSKPDWHSQYYWWDYRATKDRNVNYDIKRYPQRWDHFKSFVYNQIEELMTGYGSVDILWLDGGQVCPQNNQDIDMPKIAKMGRSHQPGLLVVDRTIGGKYENYQTPERSIPETQLNHPWESCLPLTGMWGWVPNAHLQPAQNVLSSLIEVVAKGGSMVLGVGPTPEGLIEPGVIEVLNKVGKWMDKNGRAIYHTRTTPYYNDGNMWFTVSKDHQKMYAICTVKEREEIPNILEWTEKRLQKGQKVRLVSNGKSLRWTLADDKIKVYLPKEVDRTMPVALEISL